MAKNVLIVDDDKAIQKMLADALESEGFNVIVERDGRWAVSTFEKREVDFVILDILIPIKNGFEVAEAIRATEKGKKVPILMVSGIYRSYNNAKKAKDKYSVVDYLDKPLKLDKILEIMRATLGDQYPAEGAKEKAEDSDSQFPEQVEITSEELADEQSIKEKKEVEEQSAARGMRVEHIRGNLRNTPFSELLAMLHRQSVSGALLLKNSRIKKIVFFKDGQPVYVKSNLLSECLGKIMVRENMITQDECDKSIEVMKQSRRQQGTVLIDMGIISPHNLVYALEKQLEIKLYDIFSWADGDYQFNTKTEAPGEITTLEKSAAGLIYEGIKRKFPLSRIEAELAPYFDRYVGPSSDPLYRYQEMNLFDEEEKLLEKIDGTRVLRDLVSEGGLKREAALKLLYALKTADMIRLEDEPFPEAGPLKVPTSKPAIQAEQKGEASAAPKRKAPPPLPAQAPPSLDDRNKKQELTAKLLSLKKQNYYEVFGVSRDATENEIKRSFFQLAQKYHPDKQGTNSAEIKKLAKEVYKILYKAYETLINASDRKAYDDELATGIKRDVEDDMGKLLAAEGQFEQGTKLLKQQKYKEAADAFLSAIELYGSEGEFHAFYGWALYMSNPKDKEIVKQARTSLSNAISRNPKIDMAYVYLGHIYKASGMQDLAEQQYEKAIQCNPDCQEALRELKLTR